MNSFYHLNLSNACTVRLDRWLTLHLAHPLRRADLAGTMGGCLPILMYHSISDDPEEGVAPYYRLTTSPRRFAQQMDWLAELGYVGVTLAGLLEHTPGRMQARRPVAITFDDGLWDFYTTAWPTLQERDYGATMYLPTAFLSNERKTWRGKACLTWNEVREMRAHGIQFGSHSLTHPVLYGLPLREIGRELTVSKQFLEQELGEEITSFAYPYAFPQEDRRFAAAIGAMLSERRYRSCVTTMVGRSKVNDDLFSLRRLPINSCDDKRLLRAKLEGAYDWVGSAQHGFRRLKGWVNPQRRRRAAEW